MTTPQQLAAFNYSAPPFGRQPIKNVSTAYLVQPSDNGLIINCTANTFTVSLTAAATLGSGFTCWVWNTSATITDVITIDPNGAETIDGLSTIVLRCGEGCQIVCNGTNWETGDKKTMRLYAENTASSSTRPVASGDSSVAVGRQVTASAFGAVSIGYLSTASGSSSYAFGRSAVASSSFSTAIGTNSSGNGSQAVTGSGAMALGGSYASGTDSFAAAVANNTSSYGATGANSVAIGYRAKATGIYAVSIGPETQATASGAPSFSIGQESIASGVRSVAIGAYVTASEVSSVALGNGASSLISGKFAFSGSGVDGFTRGAKQTGVFVLMRDTTSTTATVLTTDNSAPGNDDQVILPNNSAYAFSGLVVARQQAAGGTASAAWKIEGLIRREGSAGTTTLVASTVTAIDNTPGWTLALSADTTNGGLAITATGAAATNIRWVATVQTSEVTYA